MADLETLHFLTCGHVDDGKSTLIGRLLYEIGAVPDDQVKGAMTDSGIDYSRLTDGLEDERAQGITIDVACRYFRHDGRHYRIADTPGHVQYVRNMAVAAANSDCALILVDAGHGVREQTLRHSRIAVFFGLRHFIIVVNKMDLVDYDEGRFREIEAAYRSALGAVPGMAMTFIPASAIGADNLVSLSSRTPWYRGPSVLTCLAETEVATAPENGLRLPVQSVIRAGEHRGCQGMLTGGRLHLGDTLGIAGSGLQITVSAIYHGGRATTRARPGQSITVVPAEDVDLSRGAVLHAPDAPAQCADAFDAEVIWLDPEHARNTWMQGFLKIHHREEQAEITVRQAGDPVSAVSVFTASPVALDGYESHRATGLFLLIEPETEKVAGVGTVSAVQGQSCSYSI